MKKTIIFITIFCLLMTCVTTINAAESEKTTPSGIGYKSIGDKLDEYVKKNEKELASCEVAVFDGEGLIVNRNYGYSDVENKVLADEKTVYEWGSCSKILIWVSVMQQVEQGKIDLDKDIREYLPDDFLKNLHYKDEKITMVNLMNHTAGFEENFKESYFNENKLCKNLEEALKLCEPYQQYHVGEYTAYSNYSAALAAFVVERVSKKEFKDYVKENIFTPLGMEHTSIEPHMNDNDYVKDKRKELKCYVRNTDSSKNACLGTYNTWIQLYPAGSVIGTIEDFSKFGMELVSSESKLFNDKSTYEKMITPTSYYKDSKIAKNCHGLWTTECKVQLLGHGGNTFGNSAMINFDPASGLGVVIMTNMASDLRFNYGIPNLIFGEITDRDEYSNGYLEDDGDISDTYFSKRTFNNGPAKILNYTEYKTFKKNKDGNYDNSLYAKTKFEEKMYKIGPNQYVIESNGVKRFANLYVDDNGEHVLEQTCADMASNKTDSGNLVFYMIMSNIFKICLMILAVKLVLLIVWKIRKKKIHFNKQIIITQVICAISGIILLLYASMYVYSMGCKWLVVVSSILATALGLFALVNGGLLIYKTIKKDAKVITKINGIIWGVVSIMFLVYIIVFEIYKFWLI